MTAENIQVPANQQSRIAERIRVLETQNAKMRRLAQLQAELRKRTLQKISDDKTTANALAIRLGLDGNFVRFFLRRNRVITGGTPLTKLCQELNCPEIVREIGELVTAIDAPKHLPLAVFTNQVIDLYYALELALLPVSEQMNRGIFSEIFGEHKDVVLSLLLFGWHRCDQLDESDLPEKIQAQLKAPEWPDRLRRKADEYQAKLKGKGKELQALVHELLTQYGFGELQQLAKVLDVSRSTLRDARAGISSEELIDELLHKVRAIKAQHGKEPSGQVTIVKAPGEVAQRKSELLLHTTRLSEPTQTVPVVTGDVPPDLAAVAGGVSPTGLPFVLTAETVRQLEIRTSGPLIELLVRAIRQCRALLNIAAQIKDPGVKEEVRRKCNRDVTELWLAIQTYSAELLNRELLEVWDAQRDTFYLGHGETPNLRRRRPSRRGEDAQAT